MAEKNGASLKQIITLSELASLCVVSERTIQRLTRQGVLRLAKDGEKRLLRGRYELCEVQRFVEHLRDSLTSDDPHATAYNRARTARMLAIAESEELRVAQIRGELLKRERVVFVVTRVLGATKNHLLGIPSRVMHTLQGEQDPKRINAVVGGEIRQALTEISQFNASHVLSRKRIARHRDRNGEAAG